MFLSTNSPLFAKSSNWKNLLKKNFCIFVNMSLFNNDFSVASFLYWIQKLERKNWINMFLSTNSPLFANQAIEKKKFANL
jgi:hypothetical protein